MEKKKIILAFLPIILLLTIVGSSAATPVRTAGVSAGDTLTYGNSNFSWNSNDPTATPPAEWVGLNGTTYALATIGNVVGTNVTGSIQIHYNNGTVQTQTGWVDVDTGDGVNMTFFLISANLNPNDPIYSNSTYSSWTINETIPETYSGVQRDTNHMNVTIEESVESYYIYTSMNFYWDKATGVLTKLSIIENETITYTTNWSISFTLTGTNKWAIPEFSGLPPTLLLLASLTFVTIVYRRKLHKTQTY